MRHSFRLRTEQELAKLNRETRTAIWKGRLSLLLYLLAASIALLLAGWVLFPDAPLYHYLAPYFQ